MLELRGVSKVYGRGAAEVHALHQVDLSVDADAMVAVMAERKGQPPSHAERLLSHRGRMPAPGRCTGLRAQPIPHSWAISAQATG